MSTSRTRVASFTLALVVVTSLLTVASVAPASAAQQSFVIEQGNQCIPVTPLSGGQDVVDFYDYRNPYNTVGNDNYSYSSHMPSQLTAPETSRMFLYDGPNGVSLVITHHERDAPFETGSAATFRFGNLPASGQWVLYDDTYPNQDDRDSRTRTDWTWRGDRNDGGVFRGIDDPSLRMTIAPAWNEDAPLYDSPEPRSGHITSWQVLSGSVSNPQVTTLSSMTAPVTIRAGTCGGDETPPNADLTVSSTAPTVGEQVTFDAQDANDDSGITEYRWDFDGDGTVDSTTSSYRTTHAYEGTGSYDAAVTVADAAGNTATATVSITVGEESTSLEARSSVPDTADVGEAVTVDGSSSTGDSIASYAWDFGDGANAAGATASHAYSQAGRYDVTLAVTDANGTTDTVTKQVVINEQDTTTTPPEENTTTPPPEDTTTTPPADTTTVEQPPEDTPTEQPPETTTGKPPQTTGKKQSGGSTSFGSGVSYSAGVTNHDDDEPTPTPEPPEMSVTMEHPSSGTSKAAIENARPGETASLDPPRLGAKAGTAFRSVDFTLGTEGDYDFTLRTARKAAGATPLSVETDGATAFAYLDVEHPGVEDANLSNASVTFDVSAKRLDAANVSADDVALYRRGDGTWTELDTKKLRKEDGKFVFKAATPGFSSFAIGAKRASIGVEDVTLSDSTLDRGDRVTVTAKVTNGGGAAGDYTVELTAFDEVVDSKRLTLAPGESKSVTFVQQMNSAGTYDLSVNGRSAKLNVAEPETTTETATPTTSNDSGQPGFGVFAALAALIAAFAVALRRRD